MRISRALFISLALAAIPAAASADLLRRPRNRFESAPLPAGVEVTGPAANEIARIADIENGLVIFGAKCKQEAGSSSNYTCVLGVEPRISGSGDAAKVKVKVTGPAANEIARIAKYPIRGDPAHFRPECRKEADSNDYTCMLLVF